MKRTDAPVLVWPSGLTRPTDGRPLVYLDLNHWISLAKAAVGHAQGGQFVATFEACRSAARIGAATFVLGGGHYSELLKIESRRQRHDVGVVIEELSQFKTLLSRASVMKVELSAALDHMLGLQSQDAECPLIGYGVMHAFGQPPGRFHIKHRISGEDVTEVVRQQYGPDSDCVDSVSCEPWRRGNCSNPFSSHYRMGFVGFARMPLMAASRHASAA